MFNPQHRHLPAQLDPRRWWALALLCGAFFMVILDANIVIVALPSIDGDFGFSDQGLQWVISAYALTFAGLLLLGGRAADLLGRRLRRPALRTEEGRTSPTDDRGRRPPRNGGNHLFRKAPVIPPG
jgi:MFS transporter